MDKSPYFNDRERGFFIFLQCILYKTKDGSFIYFSDYRNTLSTDSLSQHNSRRQSENLTPEADNMTSYPSIINMQQPVFLNNFSNITIPSLPFQSQNTINLHSYNYPSFFYHFFSESSEAKTRSHQKIRKDRKSAAASHSTGFSNTTKSTKEEVLSNLRELYQPKSQKSSMSDEVNKVAFDKISKLT